MSARLTSPDLLVVSHSGDRSGAPMVLLRFLDWLDANTTVDREVVLLLGGSMEAEFRRFEARILGGHDSRLWMVQRGLANLSFDKAAAGLAFARQAPTMWANRNAPLVFLNSVGSLPVLRFMPAMAAGKVVLYVHELDDSLERTVGSAAWDLLSPRVDHYVACGERVRDMLIERKGVASDRVSLHHGFVEEQHVEPTRSRCVRRELGIPPDAPVIGASGRPEWRKGPEVFVRVARAVTDRRPDLGAHFVWMGGSPDLSAGWKLVHDVDSAGLSERVHLVGETDRPADVMSLFDLYAVTSREDPYPLAMLEAASMGAPVVSFDNGGAVEFAHSVGDEPLAEIVPYLDVPAMADALVRLLDDPAARRELAERAQAHVLDVHLATQAAPRLFETLVDIEPRLGQRGARPSPTPAVVGH